MSSGGVGGNRHSGGGVDLSYCQTVARLSRKKLLGFREKVGRDTHSHAHTLPILKHNSKKIFTIARKLDGMLLLFGKKESGEDIDVEKVNTWVRNHKDKKRGSGGRGSGGS